MQRLLAELEARADLVIVDTAAALAVSDSLPLLQQASGTVLVARMNRSTRAGIRRLHRVIVTANGTVLGVVATGTGSGPGYEGYSYGRYDSPTAADNANGARRWGRRQRSRQRSDSPSRLAPDEQLAAIPPEPTDF
jgi:Mrp family chromosome partitioning ATPase